MHVLGFLLSNSFLSGMSPNFHMFWGLQILISAASAQWDHCFRPELSPPRTALRESFIRGTANWYGSPTVWFPSFKVHIPSSPCLLYSLSRAFKQLFFFGLFRVYNCSYRDINPIQTTLPRLEAQSPEYILKSSSSAAENV